MHFSICEIVQYSSFCLTELPVTLPPFDTPSEVGEVHFIQTPYLSGTFFPYRIVMEYSGFRDCGQVGENTKKFSFTATTLRQIQSAPTVEVLQRDWFKSSNEVFP